MVFVASLLNSHPMDNQSPHPEPETLTSRAHQRDPHWLTEGRRLDNLQDSVDLYEDAAESLIDRADNLREAERCLRRAHSDSAHLATGFAIRGRHSSSSYGSRNSSLSSALQQGLHDLKEELLQDLRSLSIDAREFLHDKALLPKPETVDVFDTMPGDAGEIQISLRRAQRVVQEACHSAQDAERLDEYSRGQGTKSSTGTGSPHRDSVCYESMSTRFGGLDLGPRSR